MFPIKRGVLRCALVCASGCFYCIGDGPVFLADAVSGGTAATTGAAV